MDASFEFPTVTNDDPSDVAVAIETARALWRRGDPKESLRWLRRAAESAESEGDDMRAVSLARAAADLQEQLRPSQLPPTSASHPPAASAPPEAAPPVAAAREAAPPVTAPVEAAPPVSRPPEAAPPVSRPISAAPMVSVGATRSPVPPPPKLEPWTPPATRSPSGLPPPPGEVVLERVTSNEEVTTPASPRVMPHHEEAVPATAALSERAAPNPRPAADVRAALRVSVETFSKGSGALLVRILGEDDPLPHGAHEALLVPLTPGVDLRQP